MTIIKMIDDVTWDSLPSINVVEGDSAIPAIGAGTYRPIRADFAGITVPALNAGSIVEMSAEIGDILTATGTNGTSTAEFQWQQSADGFTLWADIAGATLSTLNTSTGVFDNYYVRFRVTDGVQGPVYTSALQVTSIITATVTPAVQAVVDGDTWADLLLSSATDTANYASTASGTIASAVAEVSINGGTWTAISGNEATVLDYPQSANVRVTVTDGVGEFRVFNAGAVLVAGEAPVALTGPAFSGPLEAGATVEVLVGTYSGVPDPSILFTLTRGGDDVSADVSGLTYLIPADTPNGTALVWEETATNGVTPSATQSVSANILAGAPAIDGVPTWSGSAVVGSVITITPASRSGTPTPDQTIQVKRGGTLIPGDVGNLYTVVAGDEGFTLTFLQTETSAQGTATAESTATGTVVLPDTTPPEINSVTVSTQNMDGSFDIDIDVTAEVSLPYTVYFVGLPTGATAPSPAQVKAGTDASDAAATFLGSYSFSVVGTETTSIVVTGLNANYDWRFAVEDSAGNLSTAIASATNIAVNTVVSDIWVFTGSVVTNLPTTEGWVFTGPVVTTIPEAA